MKRKIVAIVMAVVFLAGWTYGVTSPIGTGMWHSFGQPLDAEVALSAYKFLNHEKPHSTVTAYGFNPNYQRQGPDDITLTWALESNYQPDPNNPDQHLAEWYVQFHGRDQDGNYYSRRPLRGSVERETGRTDAGFAADRIEFVDGQGNAMGRINSSGGQAPPRWELPPTGYLAQMTADSPAVMGWSGAGLFQLLGSSGSQTWVGQPGGTGGVRLNGPPRFEWARPTVGTCDELGQALDAIGLVKWSP